jgi:hypothetical protein
MFDVTGILHGCVAQIFHIPFVLSILKQTCSRGVYVTEKH